MWHKFRTFKMQNFFKAHFWFKSVNIFSGPGITFCLGRLAYCASGLQNGGLDVLLNFATKGK